MVRLDDVVSPLAIDMQDRVVQEVRHIPITDHTCIGRRFVRHDCHRLVQARIVFGLSQERLSGFGVTSSSEPEINELTAMINVDAALC